MAAGISLYIPSLFLAFLSLELAKTTTCAFTFSTTNKAPLLEEKIKTSNNLKDGKRATEVILMKSFLIVGLIFPTIAVADSTDVVNTECQTDCIFKCQIRSQDIDAMNKREKSLSSSTSSTSHNDLILKDCLEQCQGDQRQCKDPPPERKREPVLLKAKDIDGLYSRWQDSF